jgi:zinc/manganese transport system substrate-binding protein
MMPLMKAVTPYCLLLAALLLIAGCGRSRVEEPAKGRLRVAATTSILGDVVREIGGTNIHLTVLLQPGQDPHSFNPAPADLADLSRATLLFANGLGLEQFLARLPKGPDIVEVSKTLNVRRTAGDEHDSGEAHHDHDHAGDPDPHVWFDPANVGVWTDVICQTLSARDPAHQADYEKRAADYQVRLADLDAWIRAQAASLPVGRRHLVTDHAVLNYFAARYGFTVSGVIVPSFSSAAEPSARDMAALEETIRRDRIPALFLTSTASPALGERLAADTGIRVALFYDGSLSGPDGPASTYLDFMRHNVSVFINALKD